MIRTYHAKEVTKTTLVAWIQALETRDRESKEAERETSAGDVCHAQALLWFYFGHRLVGSSAPSRAVSNTSNLSRRRGRPGSHRFILWSLALHHLSHVLTAEPTRSIGTLSRLPLFASTGQVHHILSLRTGWYEVIANFYWIGRLVSTGIP